MSDPRPLTTPSSVPAAESGAQPGYPNTSVLTPPTSPRQNRSSSNISNIALPFSAPHAQPIASPLKSRGGNLDPIQTNIYHRHSPAETRVPHCPFEIRILKDHQDRDAIFGTGAWSVVYKGTTHTKASTISGSLTPPQSPTVTTPVLVAVKKPARRDATTVLESEAQVLQYLHTIPESEKYIVPFYGVIDEATLILEALPFSLEDHIRKCAVAASHTLSTWTMSEPIIGGSAKWLHLAKQLISALAWLHTEAEVVHGDIKPGNILLAYIRGSSEHDVDRGLTFEPVFADFSSAQLLNRDETTPNTLSALTREYTAPELLSSKVLHDPSATATTASDVFSLAVTLLVAATGQMLVYPGSVFQRQAMATQGWLVLNHIRNGEQGARVPRMGIVERVVERAVLKADMGRVNAQQWWEIVEGVGKGEPMKL
ncbi:uncharacterized protein Z518_04837 [Rhinocladiella mackenziei CBS 650.93]|uniref:Protein kinase domain-containing protein n=1 Tax=Rhinocladiella mackenziei CBS 650.93 TaxID=1442369 RepID=A0A0D2IUM5_9EURO|nr:uncharacterized protein Z518_04837 [Rhinocladiella mackenziei CBS 650.93]KIX06861.1 hypothetical protein Z518_04837 [Rhinocladiella mackenziei CBS 650.93]